MKQIIKDLEEIKEWFPKHMTVSRDNVQAKIDKYKEPDNRLVKFMESE